MKMRSGFCMNGFCEGTKPKTAGGVAIKTCEFFLTCACKCHADLWMMSRIAEIPRQVHDNPEYVRPEREFWMPSDDPNWVGDILSMPSETDAPRIIESPAPDLVPVTVARSYMPTATGRTARGQLEYWVRSQCNAWLLEKYDFVCTPVWIAEEISREEGIDPPSVGAINAVFERWIKLGFAIIEKKPTRFTGYTEEGLTKGLERMKDEAKKAGKRQKAERYRQAIR